MLATLVWEKAHQCFRVFVHLALPFGAIAAVWHYTRISQGVCGILRRPFAIPQLAYVDDFLRCVPRCNAAICEDAFQRVHRILGIPLKTGKDKVAARVEALGGVLVSGSNIVAIRTTDERSTLLRKDIENFESDLAK